MPFSNKLPMTLTLDKEKVEQELCTEQCVSQICVLSALQFLSNLEQGKGFHSCTDKQHCTIKISILSSLVVKHRAYFYRYHLPINQALHGLKPIVEPNWTLNEEIRIQLIQILHLLANMIQRKTHTNSSLISFGFNAAIDIFQSLNLEKDADTYIR